MAPHGVSCLDDPIYMDYSGYCNCEITDEDKQCSWISYYYDYEEAVASTNRNLAAEDPKVDCYKEPNFRDEEGFCSCASDLESGSRYCQWWEH